MLKTYTNTTTVPQVYYDEYGTPYLVEPGNSVTLQVDSGKGADIAKLIVKDVTVGAVQYIGYALPGTADADYGWAIAKIETIGGINTKLWAGGRFEFRYQWTQRASYSYS